MTRDELLETLKTLRQGGGRGREPESAHQEADKALLEFINDPEVSKAFEDIQKWYA